MKNFLILCFLPFLSMTIKAQDVYLAFPAKSPVLGNDSVKIWMHIPANYPASGGGVLLGLHGLGDPNNSSEIRNYLTETSDNYNLLLVCPEPYLGQERDSLIEKSKAVINETLDSIAAWYNTNQSQLYMCGYSAGSDVAAHYTLENPDNPVKGFIWYAPGYYGSLLFPNIDTAFVAPIPPICLCHGTDDMVSQSAATTIENIFSGSEVPFMKVSPSGIAHTMNYPEFTNDIATCMEFINSEYTNIASYASLEAKIYPNPSKDQLIIETITNDPVFVELSDIQGRVLVHSSFSSQRLKTITLEHLKKGIYLLRLTDNKGNSRVERVVRE